MRTFSLAYGLYKGIVVNYLILSAVLGLCNSAYAAAIRTGKQ